MDVSRIRAQPDALIARVADVLAAAAVAPAQRLCVALSGGVDSVAILHLLASLRSGFGFALGAAHVHHGLSPNADHWRDLCAALCTRLDVPFESFAVHVARDHPDGLEASARDARRAALTGVSADWLVFGHHQDDQAETVLFRLLRGAGVHGAGAMSAIEPGSPGRLRPLLDSRRAEVLDYARASGLAWIEDESNTDRRFTRNLLRHEIFPVIQTAFPAAVSMLARSAVNFREADALLDELAASDAARCGGGTFSFAELKMLSDERLRNLMRWRLRSLGADAPARARLIEAVRQLRASDGVSLYLPLGDAACCIHRGQVWIELVTGDAPVETSWRGETELPWGSGMVAFVGAQGDGLSSTRLAAAEVRLGTRCEGLRMRVAAGRPRHTFKNLCQDAGLPAWLRASVPILFADGRPVWIAGIGIDPEYRCAGDEAGIMPEWRRDPGRSR